MEKYKNYYNNEIKIIEEMQLWFNTSEKCVFIYPVKNNKKKHINKINKILESILIPDNFKKLWIVSSGKGDATPDFYSNSLNLMMDSMRCSDAEIGNRNQSIVNEAKAFNKIKDLLNESFPNMEHFIHLKDSQKYSNYEQYIQSFKRVIEEHSKQFSTYKRNHPNYNLIFLIFDESEYIYYENYEPEKLIPFDDLKIHEHYFDSRFIDVIKNSKADYVIWYAPYKKNANWNHFLPEISVFDVKNMDASKVKCYKKEKMK